MADDDGLQSMSLLQYGDTKQVYLFGIENEFSNANLKNMINDLAPDHILMAICKERSIKLWDIISAQKDSGNSSNYFASLSCEQWIRADPEAKPKHRWKNSPISKAIMTNSGLIYGNEYYQALIEGTRIESKLVYGDKDIQSVVDSIEEFVNVIEEEDGKKDFLINKLQQDMNKKPQQRNMGRQKASNAVNVRHQTATKNKIAEVMNASDVTLDTVSSIFSNKEFMRMEYPELYQKLFEERDEKMFEGVRTCDGEVIFVVLPSIHVDGITNKLVDDGAMLLM